MFYYVLKTAMGTMDHMVQDVFINKQYLTVLFNWHYLELTLF